MNVRELIHLLQQCPPDALVTCWDAHKDEECKAPRVSLQRDGVAQNVSIVSVDCAKVKP